MGDLMYILLIVLITIIPQILVNNTYNKYSQVKVNSLQTGEDIVKEMLHTHGVDGVSIGEIGGQLTDHYNSKTKRINLSRSNFNKPTVASIAVAAHETGHALQDARGYFFLKLRHAMGQTAIVASNLSWTFVYLGFILYFAPFVVVGICLLGIVVLFDLVTLPVEINASNRAKKYLASTGRYSREELEGVSKVLNAAAFTYIAATLAGILQLMRLIRRFERS